MSVSGIPYDAPAKVHQKYRQDSLILNKIPENEYNRLSNGKLSCKVCSSVGRTSVFDTPQMLEIHRQSKKHVESLEELEALRIQKLEKEAKEKQKEAELRQAQLNAAGAAARSIAAASGVNRSDAIGASAPTEEEDDDTAGKGKKRKEPSADAYLPHQAASQPQQPQPLYKKTKSGEYIEVQSDVPTAASQASPYQAYGYGFGYGYGYYNYAHQAPPAHSYAVAQTGNDPTIMSAFQIESARAKYFALLRERGWIQNSYGQWYRDPKVEFDDDEDQPPPAPSGLDIVLEIIDAPAEGK